MQRFEGIWIPLVTPFRNGNVDYAAAARLARHYAASGVSGLIVCGTTGEAATLTEDEQDRLLESVVAAVQCPVVMGVSSYDTAAAAERARQLSDSGASGLLVTVPYYVRPSQEGIRRHFEAIAQASTVPLVLYNIPYRTGANLEIETACSLAQHPRIVAIKESGGNLNQLMDLLRETTLQVLCGEDHLIFTACALGAHGAIAAAAHVRPELFVAMEAHLREGRLAEARVLHNRLLPMVRLLFSEPNPGPIKAVLAERGWIANELRLPMTTASTQCSDRLREALAQLG